METVVILHVSVIESEIISLAFRLSFNYDVALLEKYFIIGTKR